MTKSPEDGESEITRELKRRIARTGENVCEVLRELRKAAERKRDKATLRKIIKAEKYFHCRNRNKRGR